MTKPFYEKSKRESTAIQAPGIAFMKSRGWFVNKMVSESANGFPDVFAARAGRVVLCEFKKEGEEPTAQQRLRHKQLRDQGVEVVWFDDLIEIKVYFR